MNDSFLSLDAEEVKAVVDVDSVDVPASFCILEFVAGALFSRKTLGSGDAMHVRLWVVLRSIFVRMEL